MGGAWPDALTRPFALLRRAPPELRLVYLVKALDSYGYFALSEVFTTYFSEFGVSDVAAGTYYGAWGTAITAYGVATGFAIDAMGVRRSLVACYTLQTLARLILAFTTNKTVAVVVLNVNKHIGTSPLPKTTTTTSGATATRMRTRVAIGTVKRNRTLLGIRTIPAAVRIR